MNNKMNKNDFVIQGSILAMAGILVRIIGLIYRVPLTRILGDQGNGYYSYAYDIYNLLILLSSQSMPLAVSKIVSEKLGKKEYKNAHKVFKGAVIYAMILGIIVGLLAFFGADYIACHLYKTPPMARPLKVLAPTLTVACFLGVLRGYFQGMGNMVPTALSQIFEQIANAVVSIIAAIELSSYGLSVALAKSMLNESEVAALKHSWGAAGGTLGTFVGALAALLVMTIFLWKHYGSIKQNMIKDTSSNVDSYSKITKIIIFTITPVLISTTIYNISNLMDSPIYTNINYYFTNISETQGTILWGIYSAKYRVLTTMPIAIASALSTAIVPSLVRSYAAKEHKNVKSKVSLALKFSMLIAFPCGMGLSFLGGPINQFLFDDATDLTAHIMRLSVFTVFSFSLSTISNAILQGIDKLKIPIKNSAISLGIHLVILPVLLIVFKMGIYAVVVGDILFGLTVSILNAFSIKKYLNYHQEIINTFLKPLVCSLLMGGVSLGSYQLIYIVSGNVVISLMTAIILSVIVYALLLIFTKTITEEELFSMPKGTVLIKLFKKIHII